MRKGITALLFPAVLCAKEVVWKGEPLEVEVAPASSLTVNVPCRIKNVWWFPKEVASAQAKGKTAIFFLTTRSISGGVLCSSGRSYVLNVKVDYKEPEWDEKEMKWKVYESKKPKSVVIDVVDPETEEEERDRIGRKLYMNKEEILAQGRALMVGMVTSRQVENYSVVYPTKPFVVKRDGFEMKLVKKYEGELEGYVFRVRSLRKTGVCVREPDFSSKGTVYIYIDAYRRSPACGDGFLVLPDDFFYLYVVRVPLPEEDVVRIPYVESKEEEGKTMGEPEGKKGRKAPPLPQPSVPVQEFRTR